MMDTRKNGTGLVLRDDRGRYLSGTCGGPGRPLNSRPRLVTALRDALDEDDTLERLRRVAIERMEAGDPAFWKMLLDRVWPARVEVTGEDGGPLTFAALAQRARDGGEIERGER